MRSVFSAVRLAGTAAALASAAVPLASQSERLFRLEHVSIGISDASAIAIGALDGDGRPDAVVGNAGATRLAVLIGDGAGSFASVASPDVGHVQFDVELADLDQDGDQDVVAALPLAGALAVLLGDGSGGVGAPVPTAVAGMPNGLALGDVDGDGDADAVAAGGTAGVLGVLPGDGAGGWLASSSLVSPGAPVAIALADFDADGRLDLCVADQAGSLITVWAGDGAGGFAPIQMLGVSTAPFELAAADVNADGRTDVALARHGSGPIVLLGGPAGLAPAFTGPYGPATSVAWADLDADLDLDLAWIDPNTNPTNTDVQVAHGDGAGGFAYVAGADGQLAGSNLTALALADFDLDGAVDALCTSASFGSAVVLLGDGQGRFESLPTVGTEPSGQTSHALDARSLDVDSDGDLDLALLLRDGLPFESWDGLALALGDGRGAFATPSTLHPFYAPGSLSGFSVGGLAAGDLDLDGDQDLVATSESAPHLIRAFASDGAGSLVALPPFPGTNGTVTSIELPDLDLDGDLDLVTGVWDQTTTAYPISVYLGDGAGGFGPPSSYASGTVRDLDSGDLDADGVADVAAASYHQKLALLLRGDGAGGFLAASPVGVPVAPRGVTLADLDGDGRRDLTVAGDWIAYLGTAAVFLPGDGAGGVGPAIELASGDAGAGMSAGDFDSDGHRDLAIARRNDSLSTGPHVSVIPGNGAGGFGPERRFAAAHQDMELVHAADFDADGRLDLLGLAFHEDEVWLYANERPYAVGLQPYGAGTSGCGGGHGLAANGPPSVGNAGFALLSTNAPENGIGLRVLSLAPDFAGSDPFGLGFLLHVDPIAGGAFLALNFASDELGQGKAPLPIPSDPALAGSTAFLQALWLWTGPCQPSAPLGLSSSAGLRLTVQP